MNMRQNRRQFLHSSAMLLAASALRAQTVSPRIRTIAGSGAAGAAGDGDSADSAPINNPYGLVIGPDGARYWADLGRNRSLRLDLRSRRITVIAGNGRKGHSGDRGPAKAAQLSAPHDVRLNSKGNIYVAERDAHVVRHIDMKAQTISTFAGTGTAGFSGDGGPANKAQLAQPHSIFLDRSDNVFICDIVNHRVRQVDARSGVITTFAGTGDTQPTPDDAPLAGNPTRGPRSIEIAPDGTMYLILREGNAVFTIDPGHNRIKRLAGTGELRYSGDGGPAIAATFGAPGNALNGPKGIGYAAPGLLYVVDTENHAIRRIDLRSGIISTVAGNGQRGDGPEENPLTCKMNRPHGVFVAGRTIYIGDSENHRIRVLES